MSASSSVQSLYVHVPFCAAKCEYCAFFSELSSGEQMNRFVDALIREMELVASSLKPRTIFFGGGTPSLLSTAQWRRVLVAMERLDLLGADVDAEAARARIEEAGGFVRHAIAGTKPEATAG